MLCVDALKMLQKAFGKTALSKTRAHERYKDFKSVCTVVETLPLSGRLSTSTTENVKKVREILLENSRTSIGEIANELGIAYKTAFAYGTYRNSVQIDLHLLQKKHRTTEYIISKANNDFHETRNC